MKILTLAIPQSHLGFQLLQESAKRAGLSVEECSNGRMFDKSKGWRTKQESYLEALHKCVDQAVKYVCIVDGFDVLIHPRAKQMLQELERWFEEHPETGMMTGYESACLPVNCIAIHPYVESLPRHRVAHGEEYKIHINSGVLAGRATTLLKFYEYMRANNFSDDQMSLASYMNANKYPLIEVDIDNKWLALNVAYEKHFWPYKTEDVQVPFVHFPGFAPSGLSLAYNSLAKEWCSSPGFSLTEEYRNVLIIILSVVILICATWDKYKPYYIGALLSSAYFIYILKRQLL